MKDWEAKMTEEEINEVNYIIGKMNIAFKPSINEFLDVIDRVYESVMHS